MAALGLIEHTPSRAKEDESAGDEHITQNMQRVRMRITVPAEQGVPQVSGVMGEEVETWITAAQPTREQINGKGEAVHFGKQRQHEARESAEGTPVASSAWVCKTERKDQENRRVDHNQLPQAVGGYVMVHCFSPRSENGGIHGCRAHRVRRAGDAATGKGETAGTAGRQRDGLCAR